MSKSVLTQSEQQDVDRFMGSIRQVVQRYGRGQVFEVGTVEDCAEVIKRMDHDKLILVSLSDELD